jgi:hypothetical protein
MVTRQKGLNKSRVNRRLKNLSLLSAISSNCSISWSANGNHRRPLCFVVYLLDGDGKVVKTTFVDGSITLTGYDNLGRRISAPRLSPEARQPAWGVN